MRAFSTPFLMRHAAATAATALALATVLHVTPAIALTSDQAALVRLANTYVTRAPGSSQAYVLGMAIYGSWALVGWTDNANSGGEIVASKASGRWVISRAGGGAYRASELQSSIGVDAKTAAFLIANLRPLPPVGGLTANASGTSTYTALVQSCARGSQGNAVRAGTTRNAVKTADTALTFGTGSVAPTSPEHGVTIDLSVRVGTAVVTLVNPSGQTIAHASIPAGATGGVGYWGPLAPRGIYRFTITGTSVPSGSSCGAAVKTTSRLVTDAAWTGALAW